MSDFLHTPGPWACFNDHPNPTTASRLTSVRPFGASGFGLDIATLYCTDVPEQAANARLIAAAPQLLSSLIALLDRYTNDDPRTSEEDATILNNALDAVRDAVAGVTG